MYGGIIRLMESDYALVVTENHKGRTFIKMIKIIIQGSSRSYHTRLATQGPI